ncbi:hypothetical protein CFB40_21095 [Burkholderia sp. AU31652]|uniref:hypothetical protein n=1 Tax=Burkholderia sp. AU31652 TaxID=2015354 RepID=UPI000B7A782D|nr:hypothetical protein [Burkholderia sp. AU31652]OXI83588.1 hypothetical protein CFB40_21095 [Burkholderia sp. AU31652]
MTPPEINLAQPDLTNPEAVLHELLDNDQRVRDEFAGALESELAQLAEAIASCFQRMPPIHEVAVRLRSPRIDIMCAFLLGVLDDVMVSTKLLLTGKLMPSGNVMRQAIEGVAMAILCSTEDELVIVERPRQGDLRGRYWELVWADDRLVQGQRAVDQLALNAEALGINPEGIASLQAAQKFFHPFSHCGRVAIAHRAALDQPGVFNLGGHFEIAKLDGYHVHLRQQTNLCSVLAPALEHLLGTMISGVGAPASVSNPPEQA